MIFSKLPLVLAASALTLVAACDPAGPNANQNTQQGAALGALGGAVVGALANNDGTVRERNQSALIGAALGAARLAICGVTGADPKKIMTPPLVQKTIQPRRDVSAQYEAAYQRFHASYPVLRQLQ